MPLFHKMENTTLRIAEALISFVSGSAITSDDITTNLGGMVSIPVAELIFRALMIFIISAVVASLKLMARSHLAYL